MLLVSVWEGGENDQFMCPTKEYSLLLRGDQTGSREIQKLPALVGSKLIYSM